MKSYDNWNDTDRLTGIEEKEVTMKITFSGSFQRNV